jgi:hypothetical protein
MHQRARRTIVASSRGDPERGSFGVPLNDLVFWFIGFLSKKPDGRRGTAPAGLGVDDGAGGGQRTGGRDRGRGGMADTPHLLGVGVGGRLLAVKRRLVGGERERPIGCGRDCEPLVGGSHAHALFAPVAVQPDELVGQFRTGVSGHRLPHSSWFAGQRSRHRLAECSSMSQPGVAATAFDGGGHFALGQQF